MFQCENNHKQFSFSFRQSPLSSFFHLVNPRSTKVPLVQTSHVFLITIATKSESLINFIYWSSMPVTSTFSLQPFFVIFLQFTSLNQNCCLCRYTSPVIGIHIVWSLDVLALQARPISSPIFCSLYFAFIYIFTFSFPLLLSLMIDDCCQIIGLWQFYSVCIDIIVQGSLQYRVFFVNIFIVYNTQ